MSGIPRYPLTENQRRALQILEEHGGWMTPEQFAAKFWPDRDPSKTKAPAGGMFATLRIKGWVDQQLYRGKWEATVNRDGLMALHHGWPRKD
jgi:hypothetical protein